MIVTPKTFPHAHPFVTNPYDLSTFLTKPSSGMYAWADLLADVAFRIPLLHIAAHHPAPVFLYEIRCKNPYAAWDWSFGRANHAVNDLNLFDVAPDAMPEDLQKAHAGNVAQIRGAWLDFCYAKRPWSAFRKDDGELGAVRGFEHGELGRDGESLGEALGEETGARWRAVLEVNS